MVKIDSIDSEISLYFHIPFCTKKCDYCHFYVLPNQLPLHEQLMEGFLLDIENWSKRIQGKRLASIYFGGGTPALFPPEKIACLLKRVNQWLPFDPKSIEITIEANPENLRYETMQAFAAAGINRVSIGVQSLDDSHLIKLGRTHAADAATQAVETTLKAGIENISIDLMYDIPGQTLTSWEKTLEKACKLPITHLSLYNLTFEPGTVFFKYRASLMKELPEEAVSSKMYEMAHTMLEEAGLIQYEISAFARADKLAIHNTGYWTGRPFIGFGPSAFSYYAGERFCAVSHLNKYVTALKEGRSPIDFAERLEPEPAQRELLAIALRLKAGVSCTPFQQRYGNFSQNLLTSLTRLQEMGLLTKDKDTIALSPKGVLFYDTVATELI